VLSNLKILSTGLLYRIIIKRYRAVLISYLSRYHDLS